MLHTYAVGDGHYVVHNCDDLPWSSNSVKDASNESDAQFAKGTKELNVTVSDRSEAEEIFLGKFQGDGYSNTTGFNGPEGDDWWLPKKGYWEEFKDVFGSKAMTYHWDEALGEGGRVMGHGEGNRHGGLPHLQIHGEFHRPHLLPYLIGRGQRSM